jgi:hypothetical protein
MTDNPQGKSGPTHAYLEMHCAALVLRNLFQAVYFLNAGNCLFKQDVVLSSEHRPRWDETSIHAGQGNKIHFYILTSVTP